MTCEQAMELLSPMLDGELDPQLNEALEAHLKTCPECRRLADSLRGLDGRLSELREPAPQSLKQGVLYRIDQAAGRAKKPRSRWFGPGTAIGAVAAVLVLLVGLGVIPLRSMRYGSAPEADVAGYCDTQSPATDALGLSVAPGEILDGSKYGLSYEANAKGVQSAAPADAADLPAVPDATRNNVADDVKEDYIENPADTYYRNGNSSGESDPQPVTEKLRDACATLSAEDDAAVLLYTEFDSESLFGLLEAEQPELYALVEKLEPEARDGMLVYGTDCGTALAIHEWLLEHLPRSELMDAGTEEAESKLRMRMEELDPGSGNLYKIVTWAHPTHAVVWPESWPVGWAVRIRTEENWALFFPAEGYTPNADKPAWLAFPLNER